MLKAFHMFHQSNVTYLLITQEIDYTTPEGHLFMTMLGALAQYFSDSLSGHTKNGMRERAQQGMFSGEPPWGYERRDIECIGLDETHSGCHIDKVKGPKIVELFERYATGTQSMSSLSDWLNEQGFRTNGKRKTDSLGRKMEAAVGNSAALVCATSSRTPFYTEQVRHKDELFQGKHQPLIDKVLFERVQQQSHKTALAGPRLGDEDRERPPTHRTHPLLRMRNPILVPNARQR